MLVTVKRDNQNHVYDFIELPLTKEGLKAVETRAGVYMFVAEPDTPVYIGTSWRLNVRLNCGHEKLPLARSLGATKLCCFYTPDDDYRATGQLGEYNIKKRNSRRQFEKELIQLYKPPLNKIKGQDTGYRTVELLLSTPIFVSIEQQALAQGRSVNEYILEKLQCG